MNSLPPLADGLPAEALAVLSTATKVDTRYKGCTTVWHTWGDGVPLVLLHGGSGSWAHWMRNVQALASLGRKVIAVDIPGFGDSDVAQDGADADGVFEPIAAGMREITGGAAVDVVAFSFGGLVAALLTQSHPELVRRLILVAPGGLGVRVSKLRLMSPRGVDDPAELEQVARVNLARLMLHRPESIDDTAVRTQLTHILHDRMRNRRLAMSDIVARILLEVRCPVDVIIGSHDQLYGEIRAEIDTLFGSLPTVRECVWIDNAGHWVQFEEADAFNAQAARLLAKP